MTRKQAETLVLLRREVLDDLSHETDEDGTVFATGYSDGSPMTCVVNEEGVCHWL